MWLAHALAIESGRRRAPWSPLPVGKMERQSARPATADLHRREMTVGGRGCPERLGADGLSVDLDVQRVAHDRRSLHDRILADGALIVAAPIVGLYIILFRRFMAAVLTGAIKE